MKYENIWRMCYWLISLYLIVRFFFSLFQLLRKSEERETALSNQLDTLKKGGCSEEEVEMLRKKVEDVELEMREKEILYRSEITTMEEDFEKKLSGLDSTIRKLNNVVDEKSTVEAEVKK